MDAPWIEIVGCGPGGADFVTPAARAAVAQVDRVLGWPGCLALFPEAADHAEVAGGVEAVIEKLHEAQRAGLRVAVLVSGDVGLFSLSRKVIGAFGLGACRLTPGISTLQVACARFGLSWHDDHLRVVDAHARVPDSDEIARFERHPVIVFMDRGEGREWTARTARRLRDTHAIWLCERLTRPDEKIIEADADALTQAKSPAVAVLLPRVEPRAPAPGQPGTLYGIGIGPGDPGMVTRRAVETLRRCRYVFAPRSPKSDDSLALRISGRYLSDDTIIAELDFPMTPDPVLLAQHWDRAAARVDEVLSRGLDVAFPTLGDVSLYSTFIYLARALRRRRPGVKIHAVAGISSVGAAAAAVGFSLGEAKEPLVVLPAGDDPVALDRALNYCADAGGGVVAVMKIGKRLPVLLDALQKRGLLECAALARRVGLDEEELWTDLAALSAEDRERAGYLSVLLVHAGGGA